MKRRFALVVAVCAICSYAFAQEAKVISDCTLNYEVSIEDSKADPAVKKAMALTSKVVYIKGSRSRNDLETPSFKQTMIFDSKTDTTIVLRELGSNKYISYLDDAKKKEKNSKYAGIRFTNTNDKKTILGYECKKVIANLADGSTYEVYYASAIIPSTTEYEYQFKNLPGFVLEYEAEFEQGKTKVKFTATKISLVPVPAAKFDIPKTGYRVL